MYREEADHECRCSDRSLLVWRLVAATHAQHVPPRGSLFAVIGDNGTGSAAIRSGQQMAEPRAVPFRLVLMVGDNMYPQRPRFADEFERPYKRCSPRECSSTRPRQPRPPENCAIPAFNMDGPRYYTFTRGNVRFVGLDTNLLDPAQSRGSNPR